MTAPDLRIATHADVYPPLEDTHLLLRALALEAPALAGRRALEMGPGSGLVALTAARAGARVTAVDLNPEACRLTRRNARDNGLADRVALVRGDLWGPLRPGVRFDLVLFNPPYLPAAGEDHVEGPMDLALHGGGSGIDVSARFLEGLPDHLAPGGKALLLLSSLADTAPLQALAAGAGLAWREVVEERFFYERLFVVALTRDFTPV